jgi:L-alanine-DL-glutamate epimerase-like enolase superfamily enzyme
MARFRLTFRRLKLHAVNPWKLSRTQPSRSAEVVICELTDDAGNIGRGEAAPVTRYDESADTVEQFLSRIDPQNLGDDPRMISAQLDSIAPGNSAAKGAIEVAFWDCFGKANEKTVCQLLGLNFKEGAHQTSFTIGIDSPEVIHHKVVKAERFPILKIKVGSADDADNLAALRAAAPDKIVRADANEAWATKEEALKHIESLAVDGRIEFVEQPMSASAPDKDWIWLKERSPLPIFADESYHAADDVERAAECFNGVNVKLVKTAGISGAFKALQAARRAGLKTMLGCMLETSVLISAAAQLAELCDYLDLDGNLLIANDPFRGVTADGGILSFANATEPFGIRVCPK